MTNYILKFLIPSIFIISCSSEEKKNMNIIGSIDGLKKGTLYLQKISDSLIKNVDSIEIDGNSKYKLGDNISDSEVYYLYLKKNDGDTLNDRIPFFAEKGDIIINTRLATFESSAKISGSNNHIIWQEYKNMIRKFDDRNLKIINEYINNKDNMTDKERLMIFDEETNKLLKRRYLYSLNFSMRNNFSEVSAFIALYEIPNTNPKYIDSVYNNFTENVKNSVYGNLLKQKLNQENIN